MWGGLRFGEVPGFVGVGCCGAGVGVACVSGDGGVNSRALRVWRRIRWYYIPLHYTDRLKNGDRETAKREMVEA